MFGLKVSPFEKQNAMQMQWKQTKQIKHDVHEACDLNVHSSICSTEVMKLWKTN